MDHTATSKTFINEEFTVRALIDGIDNIMIEKDTFLPNLRIFNSDGEELPIVKTELTVALHRGQLAKETNPETVKQLQNFIYKLENRDTHLIWIKLPKKMNRNDLRVINLEYDAMKEPKPHGTITIEYNKKLSHSVVYIIKKPEDYDIKNNPQISYQDNNNDHKVTNSWNSENDLPYEVYQTFYSVSLIIRPEKIRSMLLRYSFTANKNVISFPLLAAALLSISAFFILLINHCTSDCLVSDTTVLGIKNSYVQISFGIVVSSLVIPGLIRNNFIRNSYKFVFLIPLALGIISILF